MVGANRAKPFSSISNSSTAPGGAPYGSVKALINCPVIAFLADEPKRDLVDPLPGSAVDFPGAYPQD